MQDQMDGSQEQESLSEKSRGCDRHRWTWSSSYLDTNFSSAIGWTETAQMGRVVMSKDRNVGRCDAAEALAYQRMWCETRQHRVLLPCGKRVNVSTRRDG